MICNKPLNNRKGLALLTTMFSAVVFTGVIIGLAFYLNNVKPNPVIPVTTLISADYQMESAIIIEMQKVKKNSEYKPQAFEKDILPGIKMKVDCSQTSSNEWLFDATVNGRGIERHLKVLGNKQIPDKLLFQ